MLKILGIDPGLQNTGWGIITLASNNQVSYIASGIIKTNAKQEMPSRLLYIHDEINSVIDNYSPTASAIEQTYVNKNYESSLKLAHARAVAILTLTKQSIPPHEYPAKVVKKNITGNGAADKQQMIKMINYLLPNVKVKSDEADALAIAICHSTR